jgi:hypothetical protein
MQLINIDALPNQSFTVTLGDNNYLIKIYSIDGHMSYDLFINSIKIVAGFKMINDVLLLPYVHQEDSGNILLQISEDEIPDFTRFGLSQFLYYLTEDETSAYRLATDL